MMTRFQLFIGIMILMQSLAAQTDYPTRYDYGRQSGFIKQFEGVYTDNTQLNLRLVVIERSFFGNFSIPGNTNILFDGNTENWIDSNSISIQIIGYGQLNMDFTSDSSILLFYLPDFGLPSIKTTMIERYPTGTYPFDIIYYHATKVLSTDTAYYHDTLQLNCVHHMLVPSKRLDTKDQEKLNEALKSVFPKLLNSSRYPYDLVRNQDEVLIKDYLSTYGSGDIDLGEYANWEAYYTMNITYNAYDLLGIDFSYYNYSGGVHGIYGSDFFLYDLKQAKLLSLKDIFADGFEEKLEQMINDQIRKDNNIDSLKSLMEVGYFVDTIPLTMNYTLGEFGLMFYYPPYEIASYAAGSTTVTISPGDLKSIIAHKSPLKRAFAF